MIHMENTLIIGIIASGKTTKLKELLNELPSNVNITLCAEDDESVPHHETINLTESTIRTQQDIEADFTKLLVRTPSLLVIESIDHYKNLSVPLGIPVYATLIAKNSEHAQQILTNKNINVNFERIILMERRHVVVVPN